MTHGDKIRIMSDKELTELILHDDIKSKARNYYCENTCKWLRKGKCILRNKSLCTPNHEDKQTLSNIILEWLQSQITNNDI